MTLVERKSRFAVLATVPYNSADLVGRDIEAKLKPLFSRVKTMTVDNGKQFADHQAIDQTIGIQLLCRSVLQLAARQQRNFNGLLHQYIPKTGTWKLSPMRS